MKSEDFRYGFRVDIRGEYALFTRPEMKVERVSYDCMTPSAARGILEAIYWHHGIQYVIDRIFVLNPIKFANIRRNEVSVKISSDKLLKAAQSGKGNLYISTQENIAQRASMVLKDVHYVVDAHFIMHADKINATDNEAKFAGIFRRRLTKGQCFHTPYLGCREFPAIVSPFEEDEIKTAYEGERDLGFMLYDMDYSDKKEINPKFFRAILKDGILNLKNLEVFM